MKVFYKTVSGYQRERNNNNTAGQFYAVLFVFNTNSLKIIYNYYYCYNKHFKFNYTVMRVLKTQIIFVHSYSCQTFTH